MFNADPRPLIPGPRHILITGASSGLGAALAEAYAAPGILLSLQGRNPDRLNQVAEKAMRRGTRTTAAVLDVADAEAMKAWILACDNEQPLDLVVANAGISAGTGSGEETEEQARAIFDVNLIGVLNTLHPILPRMIVRKQGQIAIMSSLAGFRGFAGAPAYCASKAAVRVYGEALRGDIRHRNVKINVICPGFVKTPMTDVNRFPMPFLMTPERAAQIIKKGLAKNRARIAFPWQMYALVRLFTALPSGMLDAVTARMPRKGRG
ncbi:MAG: SDR family NAD(P)-dependent oxidoreductase [Alphaproteobacteria bacterium]|nr:SDR family NAD(P)-dependent oxidoreductase [Alphaproteobacteria bacterium]